MGGDAAFSGTCGTQAVLIAAGLSGRSMCEGRGRPSLPPGRYFPMLLIGYFEGIDSERGLEWRCADSLSLREFLRLSEHEGVRRAGRARRRSPSMFRPP